MNEKLYRLMNWPEIEAIIYSEEDDPHRLLGPHREGNATVVQAFYPGAVSMELKLPGQKTVEMEQADEAGYYAALVGGKEIGSYTFRKRSSALFQDSFFLVPRSMLHLPRQSHRCCEQQMPCPGGAVVQTHRDLPSGKSDRPLISAQTYNSRPL